MPKKIAYLLLFPYLWIGLCSLSAQPTSINPDRITIVRDSFGVPHIFAPTDKEVGYGVAWAQAEDHFEMMQQTLLFTKAMLGKNYGKSLAPADFFSQLLALEEFAKVRLDTDVSPSFLEYVEAFCQGVNDYAEKYPKEVIDKKLFPVTADEVLRSYPLKIAQFMGLDRTLRNILSGAYDEAGKQVIVEGKGSNAFAFSQKMTTNNHTYLIANPHVNITGPEAFYELHIASDEGLNFHGMMFPGSLSPQIGTNHFLGWTHTNNYFDHTDVFALEMHPTKENYYKFDDQWIPLVERDLKLAVKIKPVPFPIKVKRTVYYSKYGPTLKTDDGHYFSFRMGAYQTIKTAEQWFRMNKATNFEEFKAALAWNGLPYFNITYADRDDNIFYIFNGFFPDRNQSYDWSNVVPGNTSKTLWNSFLPLEERPQILNPKCGYVYNVNHTPYKCTCEESWLDQKDYNPAAGFQPFSNDNLRSFRFRETYTDGTSISMDQLKAIKYDVTFPKNSPAEKLAKNFCACDLPAYKPISDALCNWDLFHDPESAAPTYMVLAINWARQNKKNLNVKASQKQVLNENEQKAVLSYIHEHLTQHFGTVNVPYKAFSVVRRGNKEKPAYGSVYTLGNRKSKIDPESGKAITTGGDNGMIFVEYNKDGVVSLETIVPFGSSSNPNSPHYDDQLDLYVNKQVKSMTLDREKVMARAKRVYHPGQ